MKLAVRRGQGAAISLVAMIDVLMIMLVFFMVTSTYLNLDMIPVADRGDAPAPESPPAAAGESGAARVVIRLSGDGQVLVRGRALDGDGVRAFFDAELARSPETEFILLPSARAEVQALVTVMDTAAAAGALRFRVVRLEARP